jgi:hypothetical protein
VQRDLSPTFSPTFASSAEQQNRHCSLVLYHEISTVTFLLFLNITNKRVPSAHADKSPDTATNAYAEQTEKDLNEVLAEIQETAIGPCPFNKVPHPQRPLKINDLWATTSS